MSEKLTRIRLPGQKVIPGLLEWGEQPISKMIETARRHAAHLRAQAEAIEKASDEEFQVDVVRGSVVQHHVKELQKSRISTTPTSQAGAS